jgi:hypothetical protein
VKKAGNGWDKMASEIAFADEGRCVNFLHLLTSYGRFVLADDYNFDVRQISADDASGLKSVHSRHGNVHQNEGRPQGFGFFDPLEPVYRLAADFPLRVGREQRAKPAPDNLVVVDNENAGSHQISPNGALNEITDRAELWNWKNAD